MIYHFLSNRFDVSKDRKKSFSLLYLLCYTFLLCRGTARLAPCSFDFVKGRNLSVACGASSPEGEPFGPPSSLFIRFPPKVSVKKGTPFCEDSKFWFITKTCTFVILWYSVFIRNGKNGGKRVKTVDGGRKGSPLGELSAKLTERFLRLTKSSELKNDLSFLSNRF